HCYQSPIFPEFTDPPEIRTQGLFHPLIVRSQVVANDFSLRPPTRLGLITGSNMSGKSTFLRTLGVNQHLAMVGAPVFAEEMTTFVGPVVTCLQIRDSLEDGYSSFYYEVKRVKQVIEQAGAGQSFLYLIDEIFRGTNNRERLLGSQAVIRKLLESSQALGMITTHDLELTQLEEEFPQLANGHFRDEVKEGSSGLHFSYLYHPGPCPTTNALKIMAAEGLPIPSGVPS
ncbi:MAG: DNA mismatch repair protein MutS, partial [Bdellovibrionales bacterium]|nr:DNA mismatch repair protein MutS [Bdellovibrionales bacterium]